VPRSTPSCRRGDLLIVWRRGHRSLNDRAPSAGSDDAALVQPSASNHHRLAHPMAGRRGWTTRDLHHAQHHGGGSRLPDLLQRHGPRRGLIGDRLPAHHVMADQRDGLMVRHPADERLRPVANLRGRVQEIARTVGGTRSRPGQNNLSLKGNEQCDSSMAPRRPSPASSG
jgi:hypothetical protein